MTEITWSQQKRKLSELKEYDDNPRKVPKETYAALIKNIQANGYTNRLIVNTSNVVLGGNQRLRALRELGYNEIDVLVPNVELTEEQENRINITDNLSAGIWDFDVLANLYEPEQLIDWGMPEDWLQIDVEQIEVTDEDNEVPGLPAEPITKLGDIWLLGEHRLMCGDSTDILQIEKLMDGQKAHCVFTSPPYNGNTHIESKKTGDKPLYAHDADNKESGEYVKFLQDVLNNIFIVTDGFVFWNINYNANSRFEFLKSLHMFIDKLWEVIIWKKQGTPLAAGLTRNHEFIFCFKASDRRKHLGKPHDPNSTIWEISNLGAQQTTSEHQACFPVELPLKGIELATEKNEIVLDLFGGSGSTLIACEKSKRKCLMMELSPNYCDVIIARWEKLTGQKAQLIND
jgi:site-specific DNA-methyltransferase (adenine-specific)